MKSNWSQKGQGRGGGGRRAFFISYWKLNMPSSIFMYFFLLNTYDQNKIILLANEKIRFNFHKKRK